MCIGAKAQKNSQIAKPINSLEKIKDPDLVWRKYVNNFYKNLFNLK